MAGFENLPCLFLACLELTGQAFFKNMTTMKNEESEQTNWENLFNPKAPTACMQWINIENNYTETFGDPGGFYLNSQGGVELNYGFAGTKHDFAGQFFSNEEIVSNWKKINTDNLALGNSDLFSESYKQEDKFFECRTSSDIYNLPKYGQWASEESNAILTQGFYARRDYSAEVLAGCALPETEKDLFISDYSNFSEIALGGIGIFWGDESDKVQFSDNSNFESLIDQKITDFDTTQLYGIASLNSNHLNFGHNIVGYDIGLANQDEYATLGDINTDEDQWNFAAIGIPESQFMNVSNFYESGDFYATIASLGKGKTYFENITEVEFQQFDYWREENLYEFSRITPIDDVLESEELLEKVAAKVIEKIKAPIVQEEFYRNLNKVDPKLNDIFTGGVLNFELKVDNNAMIVAHSMRELINNLLRELAPKGEVINWLDNRENKLENVRTKRGPTRKGRIYFLFRNHPKRIRRIMIKEADCINEMYNQLNKPSHTLPSKETNLIVKNYLDTVKLHLKKMLEYYYNL